jgi:peroxiredoxin Q/BCP
MSPKARTPQRAAPRPAGAAAKSAPPSRARAASAKPANPASAASGAIRIGSAAPDFSLPSTGGGVFQLRAARGAPLVLYFYPRDNTPGCTLEGQQFAALAPRFQKAGVQIFGISRDTLASHEKFREKMGFPFQLLSDVDGAVCASFDVIREKNMYGRKVMGIERSTFLIDAKGVLRQQWRKLKVEGHALEVLESARAL